MTSGPKKLIALSAIVSLTAITDACCDEPSPIKDLDVPARLTSKQFVEHLTLIKPAADESPWAKIS